MALGYCRKCDKLVGIEARELKGTDDRTRNYYPVKHDWLEHEGCGGSVIDGNCNRCEQPVPEIAATTQPICPGSKRPI